MTDDIEFASEFASELFVMSVTQEVRRVACYDTPECIVDTCRVYDASQPFETAVSHVEYNPGEWIIVETYATREEARAGHKRWVQTMTQEPLPVSLEDHGLAKYNPTRGLVLRRMRS